MIIGNLISGDNILQKVSVIGGGLAGCEAAWQLGQKGITISLYEMRPFQMTDAHVTADLAELVCSNSLGARSVDRASGLLKEELRRLGSLLIHCADESALPAGHALAVDRKAFSKVVGEALASHPLIEIIREEHQTIPESPVIIASGPLTSPALAESIQSITQVAHLFFYDAIAPIVTRESINMEIAFRASRYDFDNMVEGDYVNCPMTQEAYTAFVDTLAKAERIPLKAFDHVEDLGHVPQNSDYFEGCLPVEVIAARSFRALAFGPMRPVGLRDPHTGLRPYAVVQLRQDNLAGDLYNMVGFQTNLKYSEQQRVFRMIPGLEQADFIRYGQMHRNTYIASPKLLNETMQFRTCKDLFFAGQIAGVEGYVGNIASGWLAGINLARLLRGEELLTLPSTTMLGALMYYISHAEVDGFQPMKTNFGLLPSLGVKTKLMKKARYEAYAVRALTDLQAFMQVHNLTQRSDYN